MASVSARSPHEVLGISPGASELEIKAAYKRQAQRHHPDKHGSDPGAHARFQEIQGAYAQLTQRSAVSSGMPPTANFDDLFAEFFRSAGHRPAVRRVEIALTLEEVFGPVVRQLSLPDGRQVEARFPMGIDHGDRVSLWADGQAVSGWEAVVRMVPHASYQRQGADLLGKMFLSYAQLVLGGPLKLTVFGQEIEGILPAGLPPGHRLRLPGRGMPFAPGQQGDLYLEIALEMPSKLTAVQRKALEAFDRKLHPAPK